MSFASEGDYRILIDDSYHFARDEVIVKIVIKTPGGIRPVTLEFKVGDEITYDGSTGPVNPEGTAIPRELAQLMLAAFGRYFLSSEGDIVHTIERLEAEKRRLSAQLDALIAGMGRLGGKNE